MQRKELRINFLFCGITISIFRGVGVVVGVLSLSSFLIIV